MNDFEMMCSILDTIGAEYDRRSFRGGRKALEVKTVLGCCQDFIFIHFSACGVFQYFDVRHHDVNLIDDHALAIMKSFVDMAASQKDIYEKGYRDALKNPS